MYVLFCIFCFILLFVVLFVCKCVLYYCPVAYRGGFRGFKLPPKFRRPSKFVQTQPDLKTVKNC